LYRGTSSGDDSAERLFGIHRAKWVGQGDFDRDISEKKLRQIREILELSQVGMAEALDFSTVHPTNIQDVKQAKGNRLIRCF